jgi:hypothetical protein
MPHSTRRLAIALLGILLGSTLSIAQTLPLPETEEIIPRELIKLQDITTDQLAGLIGNFPVNIKLNHLDFSPRKAT